MRVMEIRAFSEARSIDILRLYPPFDILFLYPGENVFIGYDDAVRVWHGCSREHARCVVCGDGRCFEQQRRCFKKKRRG